MMRSGLAIRILALGCAVGATLGATAAVAAPQAPAKRSTAGRLDQSFAKQGRLVVPATAEDEQPEPWTLGSPAWPEATASGADGRLVIASGRRILEFLASGKRDKSFGSNGVVRFGVPEGTKFILAGVAVDSRGRALVAGTTRSFESSPGPTGFPGPPAAWATVYRFLPDGSADPSFGGGGRVASAFGQQPPTGPGPGGTFPYTQVEREFPYATPSLRVSGFGVDQEDRPVLTGGSVSRVTECGYATHSLAYLTRSYVARLTAGGAPDPSFGTGGVVTDSSLESPSAPAVGADGRIAYANSTEYLCPRIPEASPFSIGLLGADGRPINRFLTSEDVPSFGVNKFDAIALDHHNRILILSQRESGEGGGIESTQIQRWRPNGSLDQSFGPGGTTSVGLSGKERLTALAVDARNRVILAGQAPSKGGAGTSFLLTRLSATGRNETAFGRDGMSKTSFLPLSKARAATVSVDDRGRIVLGGTVTSGQLKTGYGLAFARYLGGS